MVRWNRREFVGALAGMPAAARVAFGEQAATPAFPIIDTHIHLFDKTRPEGAPYPRDMPGGGEPPQGMIALPNRFQAITAPLGVVGAIVVEASPRLDDNQWVLDVAADAPIIVGLVGRIDPADQAFGEDLDRLRRNPLFLGIRQGRLHLGLESPDYMANLQRLADADCSLDVDTPRQGMTAPEVLVRVLDQVPSLRLVMDHLPDLRFPDRAAKDTYRMYLRELGSRPQVYIKLSEVVRKWGDRVSTDSTPTGTGLMSCGRSSVKTASCSAATGRRARASSSIPTPTCSASRVPTCEARGRTPWRRCSGRTP